MTMPALLSHFGINTARFVTATGEIVFDGVTSAGNGYAHALHGAVTPVPKHTFHGGAEEPDDQPETEIAWWNDEAELDRQLDAMTAVFPSFTYLPSEDGAAPCWRGTIDTGRGRFEIGVFPRRDGGLPHIVVFNAHLGAPAGRRWQKPPHLYTNGNLCVAGREDWKSGEHTVATATAWAAHWLAAYTEWRITRRWPVAGVNRDVA